MTPADPSRRVRRPSPRAAFTLVEAVLSILVVALLLTAALQAVAASKVTELAFAQRTRGRLLAQALLSEIMSRAYRDPDNDGATTLGPDAGESGRGTFDDVDDYAQWTESPPQKLDGTVIPGRAAWTRSVIVEWVDGHDPDGPPVAVETDLKRVVVTVRLGERTVASLAGLSSGS